MVQADIEHVGGTGFRVTIDDDVFNFRVPTEDLASNLKSFLERDR